MTREPIDQAFEDLGDGQSPERLARQRLRLVQWERRRHVRSVWLTRPLIAAASVAAICAALFVWREFPTRTNVEVAAHQMGDQPSADQPPAARVVPSGATENAEVTAPAQPARLTGTVVGVRQDAQPGSPSGSLSASRSLSEQQWLDASQSSATLSFSEGSRISLERGSRARVNALDDAGLNLALEAGHLDASITPGQGYRWTVHAGPYRVSVLGTVFSVDWRPESELLTVGVTRGKVAVAGGNSDAVKQLVAGETLQVSARSATVAPPRAPSVAVNSRTRAGIQRLGTSPLASASPLLSGVNARASSSGVPAPSADLSGERISGAANGEWKILAESGEYAAAYAAAREQGYDRITRGASASELLLLADSARLAGAVEPARSALMALRERFPAHANAAVAGFVLGRLAYERGDDKEAVRWLRGYLDQGAAGPLAEGARWRLLTALQRSGDLESAKRVARDYLRHDPQGRHADRARALLSE
jgi:TolA-binding protein